MERFRVFEMDSAPLGIGQGNNTHQPVLVKYDIESGQTWISLIIAQQNTDGNTLGKLVWFPIQDLPAEDSGTGK